MGSTKRRSSSSRNVKRQAVEEKPPVLVPPGVYSAKEKTDVYKAVDYMNQRFHVGEHVAVNAGEGSEEWVAVIESIFQCPTRGKLVFRGRWFWAPAHVRHHNLGKDRSFRESRYEPYELIIADNRDINAVECIDRKCTVLSWQNFKRVQKFVKRNKKPWLGIYYCDRTYSPKHFETKDLSPLLFPGDPIPQGLLEELGRSEADIGLPHGCYGRKPFLASWRPGKQENVVGSDEEKELDINAVFIV